MKLDCGRLQEHFSIQHIGMTNLKELEMYAPRNLRNEDVSTFNVKKCLISTDKISLRDWNRFFKLWIKGFNLRLEHLIIERNAIPEWNILLNGLKAEETEGEGSTKFIVRNSRGICAKIGCKLLYRDVFQMEFTVSK
ncbi:Protein CBG26124 [Caenorhabditis briggsae]|uniref:Protein CBG26124 n=1 Tax=Caenorhabditis briggsae TaxID=6238 RepID=B6IFH1_CAEBR|nr:Protein CBG26124 [Caenorhabditis briggsae]CAR98651.1 Protein CBG26124 [Caenorhabditis briggsae]